MRKNQPQIYWFFLMLQNLYQSKCIQGADIRSFFTIFYCFFVGVKKYVYLCGWFCNIFAKNNG